MPSAYMTRATLAAELQIGESTVDEMVRRGVLPRPVRLSSGCVRWRWASVDHALSSMEGGENDPIAVDAQAGVRRALEAAKAGGNRRPA
jgi:predicted DNA-binding transcriptional regulator AlpA